MRNPLDGAKNILGRNPLYGSLISSLLVLFPTISLMVNLAIKIVNFIFWGFNLKQFRNMYDDPLLRNSDECSNFYCYFYFFLHPQCLV